MSMSIQRPSVAATSTTKKRAASVLMAAKAALGYAEEAIGRLLRPLGGTGFELSGAGFELSGARPPWRARPCGHFVFLLYGTRRLISESLSSVKTDNATRGS